MHRPKLRSLTRRQLLAFVSVVSVAATAMGCGHKDIWRARAVSAEGVRVTPTEISVAHGKLWVDALVVNETSSVLLIDRDAMTVAIEGHTVGRSSGTFTTHKPIAVIAGRAQTLRVDFAEDGFHWIDVAAARVDWNEAFTIDGAVLRIPGMEVSPRAVTER